MTILEKLVKIDTKYIQETSHFLEKVLDLNNVKWLTHLRGHLQK